MNQLAKQVRALAGIIREVRAGGVPEDIVKIEVSPDFLDKIAAEIDRLTEQALQKKSDIWKRKDDQSPHRHNWGERTN